GGTVVRRAAQDDRIDGTRRTNVRERIAVEHYQVGDLARTDRAVPVECAEPGGPGTGCGRQRLGWRQSFLDIQRQLIVQPEARVVERVQNPGIGTGEDCDAGLLEHGQHCRDPLVVYVSLRDGSTVRLRGALDAPVVGLAESRTDVGEVGIVRVRVLVEPREDAAAIERRCDKYSPPGD